jgi:hypothetical protein
MPETEGQISHYKILSALGAGRTGGTYPLEDTRRF